MMHSRLKSVMILGFTAPSLFLALASYGSFELYLMTDRTLHHRESQYMQQTELQSKLQSTTKLRTGLHNWLYTARGYYDRARTDQFVSLLITPSTSHPTITASATIALPLSPGLPPEAAKQLTLVGSMNSLITAFGQAQSAYPSITPIEWQLQKDTRSEALQLQIKLCQPDPPPSSASPNTTFSSTESDNHEFVIPSPAPPLDDQSIDAFGLPASGTPPVPRLASTARTTPEQTPVTLGGIASQLKLQGVCEDDEAIINTIPIHKGDTLRLRIGQESVTLTISEIHSDAVLMGWSRSDATYLLQLPALSNPVTLASPTPNLAMSDEIVLPPEPPPALSSQNPGATSSGRKTNP